ncbi:MAG: hypothetical protein MUC87_08010 [Bacteroidia bacterium]|jgi:hypothetical protein|nr:hypothetical protein [Bacteroidia bacterium]
MEITAESKTALLGKITRFLHEIGIETREGEVPENTFLSAILIKNGVIVYNSEHLQFPGDLLHEAGHVAVSLPAERPLLSNNVLELDQNKQGEEMAVLLWSWLAARHIGIPDEVLFHDEGYKGEAAWLREQFQGGHYLGAPLLQWMGIIEPLQNDNMPRVKSWLRV